MDKGAKSINKGAWSVPMLLAETTFSFVWWSTFVEFFSTLWFFPLNKMDFSGWEAFLGAYMLVMLVGVRPFRSFLLRHNAKVRLVSLLIALGAFYPWSIENPPFPVSYFPEANAARMAFVSTGIALDLMAAFAVWWSSQPDRRERASWGYLIGLLLLLVVRLEWTTLNPFTLWHLPIIFAAAALFWAFFVLNAEKWHEDSTRVATTSPSAVGLGIGAQLFITHLLFTTHGVTARYLDIDPFPYGVPIVVAFFLGAYLSSKEQLVGSPIYFFLTGVLGTGLFIVGEHGDGSQLSYIGQGGAALMGIYLASSWPHVTSNFANTTRPGRAAGVFILTYIILLLWSVWVVAFKFIPWYLGSGLLKERNRSLVALSMVLASLANTSWGKKQVDSESKARRASKATSPRKEVVIILAVLFLFGVIPATFHRSITYPKNVDVPPSTQPTVINGMIWNIHFGYDNFGRNNFHGVADAVRERQINVLGILESDTTRPVSANLDVVEFLAEELKMNSDYGPSTAKNTWGCGLLTSFPIVSLKRIVLPSPEGELACLIDAVLKVDGENVTVLVTHFGNTEDVLDRQLQTEGLAAAAAATKNPTIVLSYITDRPHSPNYNHIVKVGGLKDTTTDLKRYCEYIFYKGLELVNFYRWTGGTLSDTEAQVGSWKLVKKAN